MTEFNAWTYVGDGVYAKFDGWHIILSTSTPPGKNPFYLEFEVLDNINQFYDRIKKENTDGTDEV